jgi:battenin
VWSAIGFPVTSTTARAQFYHYSNWSYQLGVFVSRSSGNLFSVSLSVLWLMPMLQVANLVFFLLNSIHHYWYNYSLLLPCFFAGLLGGGVYVQGYSRLNLDFPISLREFAIASAGVADSLGILVADIASLFIQVNFVTLCVIVYSIQCIRIVFFHRSLLQSCIHDRNGIKGAAVKCPTS